MIVQIYEVADPAEAAALVRLGVDHVGVLVGAGRFPRELPPDGARRVLDAVPASAVRVALTLSPDRDEVLEIAREVRPHVLHVGTTPEAIGPRETAAIREALGGVRLMRSVPVTGPEAVAFAKELEGAADWLLLDSHAAGDAQVGATGRTHDWAVSRRIVETVAVPAILAGGLGPENVAEAIRRVGPAGVDSKTRTDGPTGKDLDRVRRFVAGAKSARRDGGEC